MEKKQSRTVMTLGAAVLMAAALGFAFWPRATMVDMGAVVRGAMTLTIDEEGRTRVHDNYVLSTPVAGRLLRLDALPGDPVVRDETVVARMLPGNPEVLNVRSRERALAEITAAEAAVRLARSELAGARAERELARAELQRARRLRADGMVSQAELDRALRDTHTSEAGFERARAAIAMRRAQLVDARAGLIAFRDADTSEPAAGKTQEVIPLHAPATGRILRVIQESETTLPVGAPILEIGNITSELEVVVELLSTDAVQVMPGDRVLFEDWGGPGVLNGIVDRVEPFGFTKFSALGVEEQRVNTIARFTDPAQARRALGHGYRVEARFIVWEDADALIVPASALFRKGKDWAVFRVQGGRARLSPVEIGHNNGIQAQVLTGLEPGDRVVLYPPSGLSEGMKVVQRGLE